MHRLWQTGVAAGEPGYERHGPQIEERRAIVGTHREKFWPPGGVTERCIAINCGTGGDAVAWADGLDAEEREKWKEKFPEDWVTGAIDYCHDTAVLGDPLISDLKTGRREEKSVTERRQQWVYALAERLITGADRVVGNVVLHPRYPKDAPPRAIWGTWEAAELDEFHRRLKARRAEMREKQRLVAEGGVVGVGDVTKGEHCAFCESKRSCPLRPPAENYGEALREWLEA